MTRLIGNEWLVLLGYNCLVLLVFGWDKHKARRGSRRISEATLLWMTACLGGPGGLVGMLLWRHKTRKPRFAVGIPLLTLVQLAAASWGRVRGYW